MERNEKHEIMFRQFVLDALTSMQITQESYDTIIADIDLGNYDPLLSMDIGVFLEGGKR